jgi:hypothetical protein
MQNVTYFNKFLEKPSAGWAIGLVAPAVIESAYD